MSDEELESLKAAEAEAWESYVVIDEQRSELLRVWANLNRRVKAEELHREVRAEILAEQEALA